MNCLCHALILAPPTRSVTNHQNVPIASLGVIVLYTPFIAIPVNCWEWWYTIFKGRCSIFQLWLSWFDSCDWFYTHHFILGFHAQIYFQHMKKGNITEEAPYALPDPISDPENYLRLSNHEEWDCFSVGNRPEFLWLSWYSTVTNQYYPND